MHNDYNLAMLAAIMSVRAISLFYSYAREDRVLREQLEKHLKLLQRQGLLSSYYDRRVDSLGDRPAGPIDSHLACADIILLLISENFLASDYCFDVEMKSALARHAVADALVVPILLRPVDNWQSAPFGHLQCLPKEGRPVTLWPNQDEAWVEVAGGIRLLVEQLRLTPVPVGRRAPPVTVQPHRGPGKVRRAHAAVAGLLGLICLVLLSSGAWWGTHVHRPSPALLGNPLPADAAVGEPPDRPRLPTVSVALPTPPSPTARPPLPRPRPTRPPLVNAHGDWEQLVHEGQRVRAIPDPRKAIDLFKKALPAAPPKSQPQIKLELAQTYRYLTTANDRDEARGYYQQVVDDPSASAAARQKAQQGLAGLKASP